MKLIYGMTWDHHYSGWAGCLNSLQQHFECLPNIDLVGCLDHAMAHNNYFISPWVGFLHNVPKHPLHMKDIYGIFDLDLERMVESDSWKESIIHCKKIFVLSQYSKNFLIDKTNVPICVLKHPTFFPDVKFDIDGFTNSDEKCLILVGQWLRDFQAIFDIETPYKKKILVAESFLNEAIHRVFRVNDDVEFVNWLPKEEYDRLLSSNLVFCPLFDCSACNTLVECIARNTPIVLPRLPAAEEYLGSDYPLFYDSLQDASALIENHENVVKAHLYLVAMNKQDLTFDYFSNSFLKKFVRFI